MLFVINCGSFTMEHGEDTKHFDKDCKYWNLCYNENCSFRHPQFCKHGVHCNMVDEGKCKFRHHKGEIMCSFGNACHNDKCEFKHPDVCKFGAKCRNIILYGKCDFYHEKAEIPCKKWYDCKEKDCPYRHPTSARTPGECRWMQYCMKFNCTLVHPVGRKELCPNGGLCAGQNNHQCHLLHPRSNNDDEDLSIMPQELCGISVPEKKEEPKEQKKKQKKDNVKISFTPQTNGVVLKIQQPNGKIQQISFDYENAACSNLVFN